MGNFELEFLWAGLRVGRGYAGKAGFLVFNAEVEGLAGTDAIAVGFQSLDGDVELWQGFNE